MSRVYAPLELAMLEQLTAGGHIEVSCAFTVTPQLRESLGDLDEEEREHFVTQLAAAACGGTPIAVIALEVAERRIDIMPDVLAGCQVNDVRIKDVVCFFISDDEFDEDVDLELSWYDVSEVSAMREALTSQ